MPRFLPAALLGSVALLGCAERSLSELPPVPGNVVKLTIPVNLNRNIDILFVIDDSGSMGEEQASLARNFPAFINLLSTIEGGLPDVHIGVVSSNVGTGGVNIGGCSTASQPDGDDGNLQTNGCAGATAGYLEDIRQADGSRLRNYSGDLASVFTCMAQLGTTGCGFEAHLESAYRALQPGKNPGFLRPDAYLAIVFVADEDDCSALPGGALFGDPMATIGSPLGPRTSFRCWEFGVECDNEPNPRAFGTYRNCRPRAASPYMQGVQRYVDYVRSLKDSPRDIVVAGIIGNVDDERTSVVVADPDDVTRPMLAPACTSAVGVAAPAHRIQAFLDSFGDHATQTTICNENLDDALVQIGELLKITLGAPCLDAHLADRNPSLPGVQVECSVADVLHPDAADRVETSIPACDTNGGAVPCWRFIADPAACPTTLDNRMIVVDRGGASVPSDTFLEVQCVVCDPATAPPGTCS